MTLPVPIIPSRHWRLSTADFRSTVEEKPRSPPFLAGASFAILRRRSVRCDVADRLWEPDGLSGTAKRRWSRSNRLVARQWSSERHAYSFGAMPIRSQSNSVTVARSWRVSFVGPARTFTSNPVFEAITLEGRPSAAMARVLSIPQSCAAVVFRRLIRPAPYPLLLGLGCKRPVRAASWPCGLALPLTLPNPSIRRFWSRY